MPVAQQRAARRRRPPRRVRGDAADAELPARARRRRPRARRDDGRRHPRRRRRQPRQARPRPRTRSPPSAALLRYFNDYFGCRTRCPSSTRSRSPGGFSGGMENWGAIVYNESTLLVDPADRDRGDAPARLRPDRARDGAPVVRQPGDDGVVGQPLAERGVRRMDGDQGHRAGASRRLTSGCARRARASARWSSTRARPRTRSSSR